MTTCLGQHKVLKEFKIEINDKLEVEGYMGLVSRGAIQLKGKVKMFNDHYIDEARQKYKFPIKLHFKCKNYYNENDYINFGTTQRVTVKEYVSAFTSPEETIRDELCIYQNLNILIINTASTPRNDLWRASVDINNIKLLESKNVPGLKDVVPKNKTIVGVD